MKVSIFQASDLMIATSLTIKLLIISSMVEDFVNAHPNLNRKAHKHVESISLPQDRMLARSSSLSPSQINSDHDLASSSFLHNRANLDNYDRINQDVVLSPLNSNDEISSGLTVSSSTNEDDSNQPESSIDSDQHDEAVADNSHEVPDRNILLDNHNSQLQAMHNMFERRQLNNHQLQSSQELSPISIGLDPVSGAGSPFNLPPFPVPNHEGGPHSPVPHSKPALANPDNLDQGLGPSLPFGLNPLPHLLGFQSPPFDGPQRGDQSAHSNHHTSMSSTDSESASGQKVWPKIFRFTDGRINLSDFEKQKKIRLSSKNQHNTENHIESAPIMFDGRQLKRKSFLILHGGVFSR